MIQKKRATEKLKPGYSEGTSAWVEFPNELHLLPIFTRFTRYVPTFIDGKVNLKVEPSNSEFSEMVERFLRGTVEDESKGVVETSVETLENFFNITRRLILANYNYTEEEVMGLLTLNSDQLGKLWSNIIVHLRKV